LASFTPADYARRYAMRDGEGGKVFSYHAACTDYGAISNRDSTENRHSCADPDVVPDMGWLLDVRLGADWCSDWGDRMV